MMTQGSGKLEDRLAEQAAYYARASTQLSNRLEAVEKRLQALPGKTEAMFGDENAELGFLRKGDEWRLVIRSGEAVALVTEASVGVKAIAAQLLPNLIKDIADSFAERAVTVMRALQALDAAEALLDEAETKKGGQ